jgi:hypothetical protein
MRKTHIFSLKIGENRDHNINPCFHSSKFEVSVLHAVAGRVVVGVVGD